MTGLLYLINSLDIGGSEKLLLDTVSHLNRSKYQAIVCYLKGKGQLRSEFAKKGIKVYNLGLKKTTPLKALLKLYRLIKSNEVSLVHTHNFQAGIIGRIVAKIARVPVIVATEHNSYNWSQRNLFFRFINEHTTRLCNVRLIAISQAVKKCIIENSHLSGDQINVIHNGVDLSGYPLKLDTTGKKRELDIAKYDKIIGTIARLEARKGHRYLIEAAARVINVCPKAVFLIIGDGPMYQKLLTLVSSRRIPNNVKFYGFRRDISEILSIVDVFVLSSVEEGLGLAIIEAMAAKKAVVATNVGGIPEVVIDGETGILVPSRDTEALAQAILKLLKNRAMAKKMGGAGRRRVETYFTLDRMIEETEILYDELIQEKIGD